jgi:hypothetical protein
MTEGSKGKRGGICNWEECNKTAHWYNRGSLAWYCEGHAWLINTHNFDVKFEDNQPMCIEIPETATEEETAVLTKFTHIVK